MGATTNPDSALNSVLNHTFNKDLPIKIYDFIIWDGSYDNLAILAQKESSKKIDIRNKIEAIKQIDIQIQEINKEILRLNKIKF